MHKIINYFIKIPEVIGNRILSAGSDLIGLLKPGLKEVPKPGLKSAGKRSDLIGIPLFRRKKFLIALFTLIFISIPIGFLSLRYARPTVAAKNLSEESQITKNDNNQNKTVSNTNFDINIGKINNLILHNPTTFLNLKANTKEIIQNAKSIVNNQTLIRLGNLDIAGKIKAAPNQPTDRLTNQSEINTHQRESILINFNYNTI